MAVLTETDASFSSVRTDTVMWSLWNSDPVSLPASWRIVWCGLQCKAPMAFPAQLFHRPWSTQVAVMTEDARLVALHSLDTVAPIVAPSPARPLTKARICKPDIWRFKICIQSFSSFKIMRRNKMAPGGQITQWTCVSLRWFTDRTSCLLRL